MVAFYVPQTASGFLTPPNLNQYARLTANLGFPNVTWVDAGLRDPRVQNFFSGIEERAGRTVSLDINGAGALGRRLLTTDQLNRDSLQNPKLPVIFYRANQGDSDYAALEALLKFRGRNVQAQAAYTWSHSIDNQSSPMAGDYFDLKFVRPTSGNVYEPPAAFTVEQQSRLDRGASDFDQRQNLTISAIATIPAPRARSWWTRLASDWRVATLASFRTGFPFTVYAYNPPTGVMNARADLVEPGNVYQRSAAAGGAWLLNPHAFANPVSGPGTLGRNALYGPGLFNIDCSLDRELPLRWLGEGARLHLRADAFNALNHANLGNPNPFMDDPRSPQPPSFGLAIFGRQAGAAGIPGLLPLGETARQVQLMARVEW
jgi:hypothetical protein